MDKQGISKEQVKIFLEKKSSPLSTPQIMNGVTFLKDYGYKILDLIDCGSFGVVMKAYDENDNTEIAVKQVTISNSNDLKSSISEFQKVVMLNHQNIIKFFKQLYDDDNEAFFIIQEYCPQGNLQEYVQKNQLTFDQIIKISLGIIEGIQHIHLKKIIHSDLKPQNILMMNNQGVKICDLGFSKMIKGSKSKTQAQGGTFFYMPLEQVNGEIRFESDIFAIGAIICFICGFAKEENALEMLNMKNGIFPPIENNQYKDILFIAKKMMVPQPQLRLSLSEAYQELKKCQPQLQQEIDNEDLYYSTESFDNGDRYEGQFKNGKFNGKGTYYYCEAAGHSAKIYEGQWLDSQKHGYGIEQFYNGDKYEGNFKENKFQGQGTYFYLDSKHTSKKYIGEWLCSIKHGQGIEEFKNSDKYEGQFQDGKFNGQGIYYYNQPEHSTKRYEGSWVNSKKHGYGVEEYKNGDKYEGYFKEGKLDGQGTYYYYSEGNSTLSFQGSWIDSKRKDGFGIEVFKNGDKYEGNFKDNQFFGQGTYYYNFADHTTKIYSGEWQNSKKHGYGTEEFKNGDKYVGDFKESKFCGQGTYYYNSPDHSQTKKYSGYWENSKKHGKGIMEYKDGTRKEGIWKEDSFTS